MQSSQAVEEPVAKFYAEDIGVNEPQATLDLVRWRTTRFPCSGFSERRSATGHQDERDEPVRGTPQRVSNTAMQSLFLECVTRQDSHHPMPKPVLVRSAGYDLKRRLWSAVAGTSSYIFELVVSILGPVSSLTGRLVRSKIVWAVIFVTMIALSIPLLTPKVTEMLTTQKEIETRLKEIFTAVRQSQSSVADGDTDEEDENHARYAETLRSFVPMLKRRADNTDLISMSLLSIARDDLPRLMAAKDGSSAPIERRVRHYFYVIETAEKNQRQSQRWGITTWAIVGMNVLGVCAALIYIGRSLRTWLMIQKYSKPGGRSCG